MKRISKFVLGSLLATSAVNASAANDFNANRTDFRDETIYFAMTTRFYDGDPKNNVCTWDKQEQQIADKDPGWRGDFAGLIKKLDYIKALGFTAIWITPIVQNASGIDYHGYHAMDFSKVDLRYESRKEWGSAEDVDFQDLIDAAHAKGLKIVLDVVLQHTGNFGEAKLNPLFTRNQQIRNQANIEACMIPDNEKLGGTSYWNLPAGGQGENQYTVRWKYFKNPQYEPNNYYHHYGTGWNWDLPNRWWAQIAGDCVDLNTENNAVAEYIVDCYGTFIKMGVDAFRIDTSGHISPLTFNKQFIPQFHEIANRPEVRAKRLNGIDFYMFGEVCQRFQGSVVYRDQPNLSSYFYTWKSDQALLDEFNGDAEWWRQQNLPEGHDSPVGPMAVCEKDKADKPRSNNVLMQNGAWHEPDYSQASGFNVIDFPVHYSFKSVSEIQGLISQDNYYNDASFNVVYVDSHDYSPGPNDGMRFSGGTAQWAENLSWMFTFRGIPCIYYGSEVEFQAGKVIDDGMSTRLKETGRAYFGHYLEGDVQASDFGTFTATGQVAQTLNGDLAHHIQQLNKIRQAVPALRKGQYTFDGCSANGGWAFKRAYKDSYALVAVNGGATFSNVPAGTYTDIVTGKTYNGGGSITVDAPKGQGQLRVLVKGWTGGKVAEDGKFMYASSPVSHGGNPTASDPGTEFFYTRDQAVGTASVKLDPAGGSFKTATLSVTATLSETATSGWYQVDGQSRVTLSAGQSQSFTIGSDMNYGDTKTVRWGATGEDGAAFDGSATYKKVDPNAVTNIYVTGKNNTDISGAYVWCWDNKNNYTGGNWPGTALSSLPTQDIDGRKFYCLTADTTEPVNVIFSKGSDQTADITNIQGDVYFEYDGSGSANQIQVVIGPTKPRITATPGSTSFSGSVTVSLSVSGASDIYYTTDGSTPSSSSSRYSSPLTFSATTTLKAYAKNDQGETVETFTYTKSSTPIPPVQDGVYVYLDGPWQNVCAYIYNESSGVVNNGSWPGQQMTLNSRGLWELKVADNLKDNAQVIFSSNGGSPRHPQDGEKGMDLRGKSMIYRVSGGSWEEYTSGAVESIGVETEAEAPVYYNLFGVRVDNPTNGVYIRVSGGKSEKVFMY